MGQLIANTSRYYIETFQQFTLGSIALIYQPHQNSDNSWSNPQIFPCHQTKKSLEMALSREKPRSCDRWHPWVVRWCLCLGQGMTHQPKVWNILNRLIRSSLAIEPSSSFYTKFLHFNKFRHIHIHIHMRRDFPFFQSDAFTLNLIFIIWQIGQINKFAIKEFINRSINLEKITLQWRLNYC